MKIGNEDLLFKDESYAIVCCGIPAKAQQSVHLSYRGQKLRQVYQPDFIKAVSALVDEHRAQLLKTGVACETRQKKLEYERLANTKKPRGMEDQDLTL